MLFAVIVVFILNICTLFHSFFTATLSLFRKATKDTPPSDDNDTTLYRITSSNFSPTSSSSSSALSLLDLHFSLNLGSGNSGEVYLAEFKGLDSDVVNSRLFAGKVTDKNIMARRNREHRVRTEKEILETLNHPFLSSLRGFVEDERWICMLTEFCPGGDLHDHLQRQPLKRFNENDVRFYVSEVIVALEYLHAMGIVYRDLKPENVLIRSDGHIMLTDFDLCLKCDDSSSIPQVMVSGDIAHSTTTKNHAFTSSSCITTKWIARAVFCLHPKRKQKEGKGLSNRPKFVAKPNVRSSSFVGTLEYMAPEVVSREGHGFAVDWWMLGIFMYELFYGVTPFEGQDRKTTLANIAAEEIEFPEEPTVPAMAKHLISRLLIKDPARRIGSKMGAWSIKHHPFFREINWALLRCRTPPYIPPPFSRNVLYSK